MQHFVPFSHPRYSIPVPTKEAGMLRKLVPLIALALAAACSSDSITGPDGHAAPPPARHGSGMMGGGG